MTLKKILLILIFLMAAATLKATDFKFGLMSAVKSTADQLDQKYKALGGGVPAAPTNISAVTASYTEIDVSWKDNSNNEQGFRVKRSASGPNGSFSTVATLIPNTTFYADIGLVPATTYYYRVSAYNGVSESPFINTAISSAITIPVNLTVSGSYANPTANRCRVQGNYAYMACQDGSVQVLNVSTTTTPQQVGSYKLAGSSCYGLDVSGSYVYAAYGTNGLKIIDISNPSIPTLVGTYVTSSSGSVTQATYSAVRVSGKYAYLTSITRGIDIVDISNPTAPSLAGYTSTYNGGGLSSTPPPIQSVAVSGGFAYFADSSNGLKIVNVSDPTNPVIISQLKTFNPTYTVNANTNAVGIVLKGNYAFVADENNGLRVIDISDPNNPAVKSTLSIAGSVNSIFLRDNYIFTTSYSSGSVNSGGMLKIIGIFDNLNPLEFASYSIATHAEDVFVSNNNIFLTTTTGLTVFQSNLIYSDSSLAPNAPSNLTLTPESRTRITLSWTSNSDNESGFAIERKINSTSYTQINTVQQNVTYFNDDTVTDNTSYYYRLRAYNLNGYSSYCPEAGPVLSISTISVSGSYNTGGTAYSLSVSNNYAYIANSSSISIVDVSNPKSPQPLSSVNINGIASDVAVVGTYAFVCNSAASANAFEVINVSNVSKPLLVSAATLALPSPAYSIIIQNKYAYVTHARGICVIDISNPLSPSLVSNLTLSYNAQKSGISVSGLFAYYVDSTNGFDIIDISNPQSLSVVSNKPPQGYLNGITVSGNYAYIANDSYGIRIYDITNPASPISVIKTPNNNDFFGTNAPAYSVFINGPYAYVADGTYGIQVLNISNPTAPSTVGGYETSAGTAYGISLINNYAYVADGSSGLMILDFTSYASTITMPSQPSNFSVAVSSSYFVTLNWTDTSNDENGFLILRSTSNPAVLASQFFLASNANSFTDTGLRPNSTYYYNIYAFNSSQYSNPNGIIAFTPILDVSQVSSYAPGESFYDIAVSSSSGYLYAALESSGIMAINVSNPLSPTKTGNDHNTSNMVEHLALSGNYLYLADGNGGIAPVNISISSSPVILSSVPASGYSNGIDIEGNFAYMANKTSGIQIFDISGSAPVSITSAFSLAGGTAYDIKSYGNYIYVANGNGGLSIFSNSNNNTVNWVYDYATGSIGDVRCVEVSSNTAYVGVNGNGLQIVNVTYPTTPLTTMSFPTPSIVYSLSKRDNYLFAAGGDSLGNGNVSIYDISNSASPYLIGSCSVATTAKGVYNIGNYIYIADGTGGLKILKANLP
jgi:hypothetical protein